MATFDVGETYTPGLDMLYLMMVPSGNNAALTLAKYVDQLYAQGQITGGNVANAGGRPRSPPPAAPIAPPGSWPRPMGKRDLDGSDYTGRSYFVDLMNQKAQELGCVNTHFTNPHGLHNENHYSTARDMVDHRQIRHEPAPLYRDHRHHLL